MVNRFQFKNFVVDDALAIRANLALSRTLDLAPYKSTAVALLEKREEGYRCAVAIYSIQGPFMSSVVRSNAVEAIQGVEERLRNQIKRGWSHRGASTDSAEKILQGVS